MDAVFFSWRGFVGPKGLTAPQIAFWDQAFARAVNNLQAVVHPDGMVSVDLGDLFMQDLVAVKGSDGKLSLRCLPRAGTFAQRTSTSTPPPAPAPPLEEK